MLWIVKKYFRSLTVSIETWKHFIYHFTFLLQVIYWGWDQTNVFSQVRPNMFVLWYDFLYFSYISLTPPFYIFVSFIGFPHLLFIFFHLVSFWHRPIVKICEDDCYVESNNRSWWIINSSRMWAIYMWYRHITICLSPYLTAAILIIKIVSHYFFNYSLLFFSETNLFGHKLDESGVPDIHLCIIHTKKP